jgi:hypothetical protein
MITLTASERYALGVVADYQQRNNGLRVWAGRGGTSERELAALFEQGLLDRILDESGYRWWYGITKAGERAIA